MPSPVTTRRAALVICLVAWAQAASAANPAKQASGVPAARAEALGLYHQGERAYELGHFDEAITLLARAYALSSEPVLQYDLARAYEGKGDLEAAARGYASYLSTQADIPDRAAIERRVATVRAQIDERVRLQREAAEARARAAALRPAPPVHPVALGGRGRGGGRRAGGRWIRRSRGGWCTTEAGESSRSQVDADADNATAHRWATAATVSWIAGGALAAGGLVFWYVDRKTSSQDDRPDAEAPRMAIVVGPSFAGVQGRF